MNLIFLFFWGLVGLALGSFTTALVYRVPRKIDWVAKRSFCPSCGQSLGLADLFPVLSWIFSGGACRHCKRPISPRYLLIELTLGALSMIAYATFGAGPQLFFVLAALPFLAALLLIDLELMILPNPLVLILGILGILRITYFYAVGDHDIHIATAYLLSALVYAGLSWFLAWFVSTILKKDALGFGDVKFFAVAGVWLGIGALPYFLILSGFLGVLSAFLWRFYKNQVMFPFGPALIASWFIVLILQNYFN